MEELVIYKKYDDFMYYVYLLLDKLPKIEKSSLGLDIRNLLYDNLKLIIYFYKYKNKRYIIEFDNNLVVIKTLIRICYKRKYISINNYQAFCKKVLNVGNIIGGILKSEKFKG